jgi:hypothetical protein
VHLGCLGVISDRRQATVRKIHQRVFIGDRSSRPEQDPWEGIMAVTSDDPEYLSEDRSIAIRLIKPYGSGQDLRTRNYISLLEGNDGKLWANWVCDSDERPEYPLA